MSPVAADRRVRRLTALAATTVALLGVLAAIFTLADTGRMRLATNSAIAEGTVVKLKRGDTVCVRGIDVPAQTGAVRLYAKRRGGGNSAIVVAVRDARGRAARGGASVDSASATSLTVPVKTTGSSSGNRLAGFAAVCVTAARGDVALFGENNPARDQSTVVTAGTRTLAVEPRIEILSDASVSVWSQVGEVLHRATLYRPGWVGVWTYYVLFALLLGTAVAAVWAFVKYGQGGMTPRRWIILIVAVTIVNGFAWSVVTPALHVPDEQEHFAYVDTLANRGMPNRELGEPPGAFTPRFDAFLNTGFRGVALYSNNKPPWTDAAEQRWRAQDRALRARDDEASGVSSASQYSPLYYGLAVIPYKLAGKDLVVRNWFIRLMSVLMTAAAAAFAFAAAREVVPGVSWFAPAVGLVVAFEPMFLHVGAAAHPDAMLTLLGCVLIWLCATIINRGLTTWRAVGGGVLLGAMYLLKPSAVGLAPALAVAYGYAVLSGERPRAAGVRNAAFGALATLGIVGLAFVLLQTNAGTSSVLTDSERLLPFSISGLMTYIWQWFLPPLSFMGIIWFPHDWLATPPILAVLVPGLIANFNHLDTMFPAALYDGITLALPAMAVAVGIVLWRERERWREWLPFTSFAVVAIAGMLGFLLLSAYLLAIETNGALMQGRYMLPLITLFAMFVVGSALAAGRRYGMVMAGALVGFFAVLNILSLGLSLGRFYL